MTEKSGSVMYSNGNTASKDGYIMYSYSVNAGEIYKITSISASGNYNGIYYNPLYVLKDASGKVISTYINESVSDLSKGIMRDIEITIPSEAVMLYTSTKTSVLTACVLKKVERTISEEYGVDAVKINNPLYGKSIYVDGDSIAYGEGNKGVGFADMIASANNMVLTKGAKSGATLSSNSDNCIQTRISNLSEDYDYILIEGAVNDMFQSVNIGNISDNFDGIYDTTTVIGAVETICYTLINNFTESKILFVLTQKFVGTYGETFRTYWDAVISVLNKWGIPYIDLSKECLLGNYNQTFKDKYYYNSDGVHPTGETYEKFFVPIVTSKLKNI